MNVIEEAFGEGVDLYEILGLKREDVTIDGDGDKDSIDLAKLRKAYFRKALKYHPDKNTHNSHDETIKLKFQALSLAYQVLLDKDKRALYHSCGDIYDNDDDDGGGGSDGTKTWKDYFDGMFGKVTTNHIEEFKQKYKCSEEEQADVKKQYVQQQGNLNKMMEYVMLSEIYDAKRWVEDYLLPDINRGNLTNKYQSKLESTLKQIQKKIQKEQNKTSTAKNTNNNKKAAKATSKKRTPKEAQKATTNKKTTNQSIPLTDETDTEETDDHDIEQDDGDTTESEDVESSNKKKQDTKKANKQRKKPPAKAKPTKAKRNQKKDDSMQDLVAQIQGKNRSGGGASFLSALGARYGISDMPEDDPFGDDEDGRFEKIQQNLKKNKKKNSAKRHRR